MDEWERQLDDVETRATRRYRYWVHLRGAPYGVKVVRTPPGAVWGLFSRTSTKLVKNGAGCTGYCCSLLQGATSPSVSTLGV